MSKPTFQKGLKQLSILLGLLIFAPIILSLGFKSQKTYTEPPQIYLTYFLLALGSFLLIFAVYFGFKTVKTFLDTLFNK